MSVSIGGQPPTVVVLSRGINLRLRLVSEKPTHQDLAEDGFAGQLKITLSAYQNDSNTSIANARKRNKQKNAQEPGESNPANLLRT